MQRRDRLKVVQESLLHDAVAVERDENPWSSAKPIAVCSEQNTKRAQITS